MMYGAASVAPPTLSPLPGAEYPLDQGPNLKKKKRIGKNQMAEMYELIGRTTIH